ncbi:hypothetical protein [Sporosarcina limicola]|uniref:Uncharacterized protein n=1 Tax=Sporosarcina limicola TaxID=34101 RepID=A0A927R413_9BACL|nr:hypothetical protein [Sporosarcina limicola]MBE1555676.1 hypothetical protein [Sporosarcina limicola]
MEEFVLYIPKLEEQFHKKKGFQEKITEVSCQVTKQRSNAIYVLEENKLYLSTVSFGAMQFQFVALDFDDNKITFKKKRDSSGDVHRGLYELLSSLQIDFAPENMSFLMERPQKENPKSAN